MSPGTLRSRLSERKPRIERPAGTSSVTPSIPARESQMRKTWWPRSAKHRTRDPPWVLLADPIAQIVRGRRSISDSHRVQLGPAIHEPLEPELHHQDDEDLVRRLRPAGQMVPHEPTHSLGPEESSSPHRLLGEAVLDELPQLASHPHRHRHVEAVLGPVEQLERQVALHRLFDHPLALSASHLVSAGNLEGPLHQVMVQEGNPRLEAR